MLEHVGVLAGRGWNGERLHERRAVCCDQCRGTAAFRLGHHPAELAVVFRAMGQELELVDGMERDEGPPARIRGERLPAPIGEHPLDEALAEPRVVESPLL